MQALCFALFACAFNLLIGYVNLLSLGHAMFFGLASYVCAHAAKVWGLEPVSAIAVGVARLRRARASITGALAIRCERHLFRHDHRRLLADGLFLLRRGALHPRRGRHPGGAAGQGARPLRSVAIPGSSTVFVAVVFLFGFLVVQRIVNSPFGEILKAIRENEPRVDLARLPRHALQARRLHPVGRIRRARRRDQGDRRPERVADRRLVRHVGRGRADDAGRRHGHVLWAGASARSSSSRCRTTSPSSASG